MKGGPSIRRRLVFTLVGFSVFTLVVVGAVFYLLVGNYVVDRQKDVLLEQAVEVAEQVQGVSESLPAAMEGMRGRSVMLSALLRADLRVLPAGSGIAVYSGSTVLAAAGAVPGRPEGLRALRAAAERLGTSEPTAAVVEANTAESGERVATILAVVPFELADSAEGLAVVTLARADAFSYRSGIVRTLVVSGAVAVCLAIVVGWVLGLWMTRPIRRLSIAAKGIADSAYQQPVTGSYPGEMQDLADDLESMRQEVRRSEDSLRGFVSSAAHELRTPLTSIQGFSQALLDGTAVTTEEQSRAAAAIYRESTRLRRLVDTLLKLSRYDSREYRPELALVLVEGLVREEADRLLQAGMVQEGRIEILTEGGSSVVTDGEMLRQVIANLLHNAVRYGEGSKVSVSLRTEGGLLRLEVANGGPGLSAEEKANLFARFYRGRGRQKGGFGLGLALVREICDVLGGEVELVDDSALTRFRVTLPASGPQGGPGRSGRRV
jgi:signal transduction histidine kinase